MNTENKTDIKSLFADVANEVAGESESESELFEIVQTLIKLGRADALDGTSSSQKLRIEKIITMLEKKDLSSEA